MKTFKKYCVAALLLVVALSLILPGCGDDATQTSEKPDEIVVASLIDISGPYAAILKPMVPALAAAQEYVNTELDGIKGVPIRMIYRDYGGDISTGIARWGELMAMDPKPMFVMVQHTDLCVALKERAVEDDVVLISTATSATLYPPANSFSFGPSYEDFVGGFIDWLAENHPGDKMAILTWDTSYGRGPITDEVYEYAEQKGVDIVATELFGVRDVDVTPHLTRIRNAGATWIYSNTTGPGPTAILKGGDELGYDFTLVGCLGIDETMLKSVSADEAEGVMTILHHKTMADPVKGAEKLNEYFDLYGSEESIGGAFPYEFKYALTVRETISNAVDEVGWENLNTSAIKDQMVQLDDFPILEDLEFVTYTEDRRSPIKACMLQFADGELLSITDFFELPDLTVR
jgi:branched-chain amino acid transport system substrate-binding protein